MLDGERSSTWLELGNRFVVAVEKLAATHGQCHGKAWKWGTNSDRALWLECGECETRFLTLRAEELDELGVGTFHDHQSYINALGDISKAIGFPGWRDEGEISRRIADLSKRAGELAAFRNDVASAVKAPDCGEDALVQRVSDAYALLGDANALAHDYVAEFGIGTVGDNVYKVVVADARRLRKSISPAEGACSCDAPAPGPIHIDEVGGDVSIICGACSGLLAMASWDDLRSQRRQHGFDRP